MCGWIYTYSKVIHDHVTRVSPTNTDPHPFLLIVLGSNYWDLFKRALIFRFSLYIYAGENAHKSYNASYIITLNNVAN